MLNEFFDFEKGSKLEIDVQRDLIFLEDLKCYVKDCVFKIFVVEIHSIKKCFINLML